MPKFRKIISFDNIILILILVITFSLAYSVHRGYTFPLHVDEWQHLALSLQIMESGMIKNINPYDGRHYVNMEPGAHILVSEIFIFTGLDPVLYYRFLPAIFACLSNLTLLAFVYKLTRNREMAYLSMLFFSSLKSNVNILGILFFVPLTASIPLIYTFFLTLYQSLNLKSLNRVYALLTIWTAMFIIHPISAAFTLFIAIVYSLPRYKTLREIIGKTSVPVIIPVFAIAIFMRVLWDNWSIGIINVFFDHLVYEHGWGKVEILYTIHDFYGYAPLLLALIGLVIEMKKREFLLPLWSMFSVLNVYAFEFLEFTVIAPYQRMLYYATLSLTAMAGIGFHRFLVETKKIAFRLNAGPEAKRYITHLVIITMLATVFYLNFSTLFYFPSRARMYHVIEMDEYQAIKWIENKYGDDNIILADPMTSVAIYPVSGNRVVGFVSGNLEGKKEDRVKDFFNFGCKSMLDMVMEEKVDLILSKWDIDCTFLEEVYENVTYVYRIR